MIQNKIKFVSLYGESGSGKTSLINDVLHLSSLYVPKTGIIRNIFSKYKFKSPFEIDDIKTISQFDSYVTDYLISQLSLLHCYCLFVQETYLQEHNLNNNGIYIFDRSPIDFHSISCCGVNYIESKTGFTISDVHSTMLSSSYEVAVYNSKKYFDAIISLYPWNLNTIEKINVLTDGVRDGYLSNYFSGNEWYEKINSSMVNKLYTIDTINTNERINALVNILGELWREIH